jgi:hypothetical protein
MKHSFESTGRRPLEEIKKIVADGGRVIDIGGANSFADGYLDSVIDIRVPQASAPNIWTGDMNYPDFWIPVLAHVEQHGKWDYAICSHTLEDITSPAFVCQMIEKIAHKGVIVEPSKHRELARFDPDYGKRGFWHHRFIFDITEGVFTAYPKVNWIEDARFDHVHKCLPEKEELIVEWEGEIGLKLVNNDFLYDSFEHFKQCYDKLL